MSEKVNGKRGVRLTHELARREITEREIWGRGGC